MRQPRGAGSTLLASASLTLGLLSLLAFTARPAAAAPPDGQWYFTLTLGLEEAYDSEGLCLRFSGSSVCVLDGSCGSWSRTGSDTFSFRISYEEGGLPVEIEAEARFEDEGEKNSIAGTGRLRFGGEIANFGLTGRPTGSKKKCKKVLRGWDILTTPPQPFQDGDCLLRANDAGFGKPERSRYILPFPAGASYNLSQTYCYLFSTHRNELAYDFDIPLGGEIVAARGGEVLAVVEDRANDSPWPDANYLKIRHSDGTVASYIHVMNQSVEPELGERVEQGQVIARSAMSGTIDPHLHFVVFRGDPPVEGDDVPVTFSNCDGEIDPLGGLIQDQVYTALPD